MSSVVSTGLSHFAALGFTELEVDAYSFLLGEAPATGYRVAQGIGRTAASTYRALESLQQKGAIMVDETENRLCRPVPPDELLAALEREFSNHSNRAREAFQRVRIKTKDDRVYQLSTPALVLERCQTLLRQAKSIVLVDAFPLALQEISSELTRAANRGVRVAVLAYDNAAVPGVEIIVNYESEKVRDRWKGQWLNVVTDSSRHLLSLLASDLTSVTHGTWSESAFLSQVYQGGLLGEISISAVRKAVAGGASIEEVEGLLVSLQFLEHTETDAFTQLTAQSGSKRKGK